MSGRFADTNVVLYLASADPNRVAIAAQVVAGGLIVSVQVLNEIANVWRKKWRRPWDEALAFLDDLIEEVSVVALDIETHKRGLAIARRYQLSIYDAMIVAAALEADCHILFSEDMHDGLLVDGTLRIVNPFAAGAAL